METSMNSTSGSNPNFIIFQGTALENQEQIGTPLQIVEVGDCENRTGFTGYNALTGNFGHFQKIVQVQTITTYVESGIDPDLEFLAKLKEEETKNEVSAIDVLYEHINPLVDSNSCLRIDSIISFFMLLKFNLRLSIAFLTITNSKKDLLPQRPRLIKYAQEVAKNLDIPQLEIEKILKGF